MVTRVGRLLESKKKINEAKEFYVYFKDGDGPVPQSSYPEPLGGPFKTREEAQKWKDNEMETSDTTDDQMVIVEGDNMTRVGKLLEDKIIPQLFLYNVDTLITSKTLYTWLKGKDGKTYKVFTRDYDNWDRKEPLSIVEEE